MQRIVPFLWSCAVSTTLAAQLVVGADAPSITLDAWLNVAGTPPTLESLKGRVVLLEFWGTWCAPCVRAMPEIQKLHERYQDRGLTVLAISYEAPSAMRPFLAKNAYTMPVGSDPARKVVDAYGIRSWPTSIVLDKEGKVAHLGSPYDAERAVEKALGLEAGPATLLTQYLDSLSEAKKGRAALERLVEKAPTAFDLQAWARSHSPEATAEAGADAAPPTPAAASKADKPTDGDELLQRCAAVWSKDEKARTETLRGLSARGSTQFDLATFARDAYAKAFPCDGKEMQALLKDKKYAAVLDAIATRNPSPATVSVAGKDKGLVAFCKSKKAEAMLMAKKGVMAERWMFAGALPKSEATNKLFFEELSVSGFAQSEDRKSITGVTLGGAMVMRDQVDAFIKTQLAHAMLMDDLTDGRAPRMRELPKLIANERKRLFDELAGRYGKPEPRGN